MFLKKGQEKEIDVVAANDVIRLLRKILKISYFLIIIGAIVGLTIISKEWRITTFLLSILEVVSPLFIGFLIAWLFHPFVTYLQHKGIRRSIGTVITYLLIFSVLYFLVSAIVPLLIDQMNDFIRALPDVVNTVSNWVDGIFDKIDTIEYIDASSVKNHMVYSIQEFGSNITRNLPTMTFNFARSTISGMGVILIGLVIGFYFLLTFDDAGNTVVGFLPKRYQENVKELGSLINYSMLHYVQGALIDSTIVFLVSSFGLGMVGLKAPLLFGLFCGITNVIPYAGPYIGGAPAVIVGFSQGFTTGLLTLLVIVVIQFIEGNFFQPYIMSKTTKLHPVTIILGLLVFGHFWGIIGMIISTPLIGAIKSILLFYDKRYGFLGIYEDAKKTVSEE